MRNLNSEIASKNLFAVLDKAQGEDQELVRGIEVEKEHADLYNYIKKTLPGFKMSLEEFAKWIAKGHLREMRDYYTRLDRMEVEGKAEGGSK